MVMQAMRENTKWIMLATALAFVGLMVFQWGMDLSGRSGTQLSGGEVGSVNGDAITYEEWYAAYQSLYQQQSSLGLPMNRATEARIEEVAFDQIVTERLIAQELRRRRIEVSAEEIVQAARLSPPQELLSNPTFLDTIGNFDFGRYQTVLAQSPQLQLELETYYRNLIPRSKLFFEVTAGLFVPDEDLWRMWRDANETVRVRYLVFDPITLVPDEAVTVTDADISAYYEANREDFLRPARATIKYATIDRRPTTADTAAALQRAQDLRAEIAGGADFADVAAREVTTQFDPDPGMERRVVRGQSIATLEETVFSTPIGTLSEPTLASNGYSFLRVESRSADTASIRQITVPIELNRAQDDALLMKADSIEDMAELDSLGIDAIGERVGLQVRQAELLPGLTAVPGIGLAEEGVFWVFEEDPVVGAVSPVFESASTLYVFELVRREEERTMTLEEATPTARAAVRADKRLERAKVRVREAVDRIRAGETMEAIAEEFGAELSETDPFTRSDVVPGLGRMTPAIGTAFGLRTGQISGVVESDRALYIIELLERQDASREAWQADLPAQRTRVTQTLAQQVWEQFMEALYTEADIEDNVTEVRRALAAG